MKKKFSDILTICLFFGFLFVVAGLYLALPAETFSEKEKRVLAEAPVLDFEALTSGEWGSAVETYLADHVPGRDFFVGVNAYYDLYSGRQVTKDVYVAEGDRLVQAPYEKDEERIAKNMRIINGFAEKTGKNVDLMIVPSAGYILEDSILGIHDPYEDDEIIKAIYAKAGANVKGVDVISSMTGVKDPSALYYRTDHHWTAYGAYTAYRTYMDLKEKTYPAPNDFHKETYGGFYGSTHSSAGLWQIPSETVELWKTNTKFTVTNSDTQQPHDGLFYEERLEELDKYTVYLDGNHGLVTIHNPDGEGKGHLLVIRDSYANCLGTFLANSYETVTLVDLRYYKREVSKLPGFEEFTDILVCYSIGNFLTDVNIGWLR